MDIGKLIDKVTKKFFTGVTKTINNGIKFLFAPENWMYLVGVILLIILISLALFLWRKKRKAKKAAPAEGAPTPTEEEATPERPTIPKSSLVNIWKSFLKGIPGKFRRSIMMYQPFVVMGESGSGKSLLIGNYTDWQGQSRQFYPSFTQDPLLQIYLGSKIIVQEIPQSLLEDTSKSARIALLRLWKPGFKKKEPTVVVVLNAIALKSDTPESLKKLAQVIRGKINLIYEIRKEPVNVCIALTYMDQMVGYTEFTDFLRKSDIPLKLEFETREESGKSGSSRDHQGGNEDGVESKTPLSELKVCLEPYEAYLTKALTNQPAGDYLKMISFMRAAPELFSALDVFIKILRTPEPLSPPPEIIRLSLASHKERDHLISNPFETTVSGDDGHEIHPVQKHKIAAAAIAVIGLLYLGGGYVYQLNLLKNMYREVDVLQKSPRSKYDEGVKKAFLTISSRQRNDPVLKVAPNFFPDANRNLRERLITIIRNNYLLPDLELMATQEDTGETMLYLLALVYATNTNELGKLVLDNLPEWSANLGLSPVLINDYIQNNEKPWNKAVTVGKFMQESGETPYDDLQSWAFFFHKINRAKEQPYIDEKRLRKLQLEAEYFLQKIYEVERYDIMVRIIELLDMETPMGIQTDLIRRSGHFQMAKDTIRELLQYVLEKKIQYPPSDNIALGEFIEKSQVLIALGDEQEQMFRFTLQRREFIFSTKKWNHLITRSQLYLFVRKFIEWNKSNDGLVFFEDGAEFSNIEMNPASRGRLFFTGKGKIDGWYTRSAFDQKVRPVLVEFPDFLSRLPLTEKEQNRLSQFVLKQVESYGRRYVGEYRNYYEKFHIKASNIEELRYVLNQLRQASSPLHEFLQTLKENTVLDTSDSKYLQPLAFEMAKLDFIRRLMLEEKGVFPEFEKYLTIMEQMRGDIEAETAGGGDGDTSGLNEKLAPAGRIALAIFLGKEGSYKHMVYKWLKDVGVPDDARHFFMEPVDAAFEIGLTEIASKVESEWDLLQKRDIRPLADKFPFDRSAEKQVSISDLEAATHPQGRFWSTFKGVLAPVCIETKTGWIPKSDAFELPSGMLETANAMLKLTHLLWDAEGNRKPVQISVKPLQLPRMEKGEPSLVLGYIQCGNSTVFAFNQMASFRPLEFEWWKSIPASVGAEFVEPGSAKKAYRTHSIPASYFSLFHLLDRAEIEKDDVYVWSTPSPEPVNRPVNIRFVLESNPWNLFVLE